MKDTYGNKYDCWGIAERARGFVLLNSMEFTRAEAIAKFEKDTNHPWKELNKNYEVVKVRFEIVRAYKPS